MVKQSEEIKHEDGNELVKLWTCDKVNIDETQESKTHSTEDSNLAQTPVADSFSSTSASSAESKLLMPIMPDLNELTCRRSRRVKKSPDF